MTDCTFTHFSYPYRPETKDENPFGWSRHVIQAEVHGDIAGYINIVYIDTQALQDFYQRTLDWFVTSKCNTYLQDLYQRQDIGFFHEMEKNFHTGIDLSQQSFNQLATRFNDYLQNSSYQRQYEKFIDYWVNKPNAELIYVYQAEDKVQKDFSSFPFTQQARTHCQNFRGQGIAQKLYAETSRYLQQQGLMLYASKNQTENGQKMWKILEQSASFEISVENSLSTSMRKKLRMKHG